MADTVPSVKLTLTGAQKLLQAAIEHAHAIEAPMVIAVCDAGGHLLAFARMDGSKLLSTKPVIRKAMTAATRGVPTGQFDQDLAVRLGLASDGDLVNLNGGLPVIVDGHLVGGIGAGSGSGEQDRAVSAAALKALAGAQQF